MFPRAMEIGVDVPLLTRLRAHFKNRSEFGKKGTLCAKLTRSRQFEALMGAEVRRIRRHSDFRLLSSVLWAFMGPSRTGPARPQHRNRGPYNRRECFQKNPNSKPILKRLLSGEVHRLYRYKPGRVARTLSCPANGIENSPVTGGGDGNRDPLVDWSLSFRTRWFFISISVMCHTPSCGCHAETDQIRAPLYLCLHLYTATILNLHIPLLTIDHLFYEGAFWTRHWN